MDNIDISHATWIFIPEKQEATDGKQMDTGNSIIKHNVEKLAFVIAHGVISQ